MNLADAYLDLATHMVVCLSLTLQSASKMSDGYYMKLSSPQLDAEALTIDYFLFAPLCTNTNEKQISLADFCNTGFHLKQVNF
jgi:hypothetical protein